MSHNYFKGKEMREKLMIGVMAGADAVRVTLGAKGKDGLLQMLEAPHSVVTNDGLSILEKIHCDDPIEEMGLNLLKEAVSRANKQSGDGSTTATVLTAAILEEGQKFADTNVDIKQSLMDCLPEILKAIDNRTRPITSDEVGKVATVSAQDAEMGAMLQKIFKEVGKDGFIDWDNSYTPDSSYVIKDGITLKNTGFVANWMANANAKGDVSNPLEGDRVVVKNPHILITRQKISNAKELEPFLMELSRQGKGELVVMFDEMEATVLQALALTYLQGKFKVILLKAPTLWKDWIYEDFALMTGATVLEEGTPATLKTPSLTYLGTCEKIISFRHETNVVGTKDITEHIRKLQEASNKYPDFAARAAWLQSKSATVKLGARSEVELSHKRLKLEDASWSAKNALINGIVVGGGWTLANAAETLPDTPGGVILKKALTAPLMQMISNMGNPMPSAEELNAQGVWDAANIPKNAISAAISVAATVLACEVAIPLPDATGKY